MAQTIVSSPFTDNRMSIAVTHSSHGFTSSDLGKAMRSSGTNGQFVVARANSAVNAEVVGVLTSIEGDDNYTITSSGIVEVAAAIIDAATAGQVLFLAEAAGQLTVTEPTTAGAVSKPVAVVLEQNAKMLLIHYRGEVITSAVVANAPNDATYVTTTANSSLTNEVLASALKIDDFAAGDDNTDLDSSTSRHGLLRKLDNSTTNFLRGDGAWAAAGGQSFTGDTTITSGNLVIATGNAGKGIDFSANTQSAVSGVGLDSEILDWYEEGTWTPVLKADGGTTASLSTAVGRYTRIGRLVHIQGKIVCNGAGNISNQALTIYLHGIPFTAQNTVTNLQSSFTVGLTAAIAVSSGVSAAALIEQNGSYLVLLVNDATSGMSNMLFSEFSTDGQLSIAGSYTV